jgi:tRNA dimethylallyltransferase
MTRPREDKPVVILAGPTASGKTRVAMALARRLPIEIISIDSALVYVGMDIGTAKPDSSMRQSVPHHLIDIMDPTQNYSAARFAEDAWRIALEVLSRDRLPVLVGGTMLYIKAFREGLAVLPPADLETRRTIDALATKLGWPSMHARLHSLDPAAAARLDPNDAQRIQRALEICHVTGKPMSSLLSGGRIAPPRIQVNVISIEPSDRAILHRRISTRFEEMLEQGLVDEVRRLRERYRLSPDLPSMRCVGYRQTWQYLEGEFGLGRLRETALGATRQLAKRQLTWLRAMHDVERYDCLREDIEEVVCDKVLQDLTGNRPGISGGNSY